MRPLVRLMDDRDYVEPEPLRPYLGIAMLLALGYVVLWLKYPIIAAASTAIVFVLGAGLFTAKIVFRFESHKLMWGLTPIFGCGWLLFFWILWKLHSSF